MSEYFRDKTIADLVQEHYALAYVLFYYGIEYVHHTQKTLDELCSEKDLVIDHVVAAYEDIRQGNDPQAAGLDLAQLPLSLVLQYLRHNHLTFIQKRLPFLKQLLARLHDSGRNLTGVNEVQAIFPLFAEKLIAHIYEEEDLIFEQVIRLLSMQDNQSPAQLYEWFDTLNLVSVAHFMDLHDSDDDDEMADIRTITNNYSLEGPIQVRVLMEELRAFDNELKVHARIENDIFFPKAVELESAVVHLMREQAIWN